MSPARPSVEIVVVKVPDTGRGSAVHCILACACSGRLTGSQSTSQTVSILRASFALHPIFATSVVNVFNRRLNMYCIKIIIIMNTTKDGHPRKPIQCRRGERRCENCALVFLHSKGRHPIS